MVCVEDGFRNGILYYKQLPHPPPPPLIASEYMAMNIVAQDSYFYHKNVANQMVFFLLNHIYRWRISYQKNSRINPYRVLSQAGEAGSLL